MQALSVLYAHLGTCLKWLLLTLVAILSLWLSIMGMVGVGFGAVAFMLGYLFAFPVFLLNFKYPKAAVIATWSLLLLLRPARRIQLASDKSVSTLLLIWPRPVTHHLRSDTTRSIRAATRRQVC